jgi:hypothetical protein
MAICSQLRAAFLAALAFGPFLAAGPALAALDEDDFDFDWDDGEIIVIEFEDQRTFDEVTLIAPDGTEIPAFRIERDKNTTTRNSGASSGVGVGGGTGGVGVGIGIGIPLGGSSTTETTYESEAQIRVPDMTAYRENWRDWKIRIHLPGAEGTTGDDKTIEIRAPKPPQ